MVVIMERRSVSCTLKKTLAGYSSNGELEKEQTSFNGSYFCIFENLTLLQPSEHTQEYLSTSGSLGKST